jgi:hypothetical protein
MNFVSNARLGIPECRIWEEKNNMCIEDFTVNPELICLKMSENRLNDIRDALFIDDISPFLLTSNGIQLIRTKISFEKKMKSSNCGKILLDYCRARLAACIDWRDSGNV